MAKSTKTGDRATSKETKTPRALKALSSSSRSERQRALKEIRSELEETFTPATAELAEPLVELVATPSQPDRDELLRVLAELAAAGDTFAFLRDGLDVARAAALKGARKKAHAAVAAGHATYVDLLTSSDARIRGAAAFLLAFLPEHAAGSARAVHEAIQREGDEHALATEIIALGYLARVAGDKADPRPSFDAYLNDARPLVRAAGAVALVASGKRATEQLIGALGDATSIQGVPATKLPWANGQVDMLALTALSTVGEAAKAAIPRIVGSLEAAVSARRSEDDATPEVIASGLLALAFAEFKERGADPVLLEELSDPQRQLLATLARLGVQADFSEYGLPERVEALAEFLDARAALAIDKKVKVGSKTAPLWKWIHQWSNDELSDAELLNAMTAQLTKRELFDALCEAAENKHDVTPLNEAITASVIAKLGAEAAPWAAARADALAREDKPSTALSVRLLLVLARHGKKPLPSSYAPLARAMSYSSINKKLKQEILDAFPADVRSALAK
ncbi:hypothetical protein AB3662_33435 [Sorangium cellulosum]|uniref:hypothetical protein n=1 Tax=Sorangium cellulosum TaxID=56 RepID=UPI003D9A0D34